MFKKSTILLRIIFFLPILLFLFSTQSIADFADPESEAREKALGIERQDHESEDIKQQNLFKEIKLGNIGNVELFYLNNKNLDFISVKGLHPLVYAAGFDNLEIIDFILKNGVQVDAQDQNGNTAFMKAAETGNIEIVNYLIENGADIDHQNKLGETAAMKTILNNNYYGLKFLIEKNVDLSKSDYTGRTIKDLAGESRDKRIKKLIN